MILDWKKASSRGESVAIVFLDFTKASDSLSHPILLSKLSQLSLPPSTLSLLTSFLHNRSQCVKVNGALSTFLPIQTGVPQGSLLGPLLFSIFVNDLLSLRLNSSIHAYADDTTIYLSSKSPSTLELHLQEDLDTISNWCAHNHLHLNPTKSRILFIPHPQLSSISFCPTLSLDGVPMLVAHDIRLLGLVIDDKLNWKPHLSYILNRLIRLLNLLRHLTPYLDYNSRLLFYYNFMHPIILLGLPIYYFSSPSSLTQPIFLLQKKAIRLVTKTHLSDKVRSTSLFIKCSVLPLPSLAVYHTAILGHSVLSKSCPPYLLSHFPSSGPSRSRPTLNRHTLPSSHSYTKLENTFVTSFNSLPRSIRSFSSSTSFKRSLKKHLLESL